MARVWFQSPAETNQIASITSQAELMHRYYS